MVGRLQLSIIKTQQEIELIKKSCKLVSDTLSFLSRYIQPGVTTSELDQLAEKFIFNQGAIPAFKYYSPDKDTSPFPCTLCTSLNEEVVHGIPSSNVVLKEGDILSVDCGVLYGGYYGDSAYTFAVGEIEPPKKKLLEVTLRSLYRAIEFARDGARIGDISYAIQQYVESHGLSVVKKIGGHGIGKSLHEPPLIPNFGKKGEGEVLREGMVLAIEPIATLGKSAVKTKKDGWTVVTSDQSLAAHYEHTILITKEKAEILTNFDFDFM